VLFTDFCLLFKIIIISAIEGITEFLPISSTAHILVVSKFVNFEITMDFLVGIQAGAILAVLFLYFRHIKTMFMECITLKFNIIPKLIIITIPTCIFGLIVSQLNYLELFPKHTISTTLILGGIVMLFFQQNSGNIDALQNITYKNSLIIAMFQTIAIIPGVSRSASVIVGGLVCNLTRTCAMEVSFFSGVPIILIATAYELFKSYKSGIGFNQISTLSVGFICSFIFSCIGILILKRLTKLNIDFKFFGFYRIIIGSVLFFIM